MSQRSSELPFVTFVCNFLFLVVSSINKKPRPLGVVFWFLLLMFRYHKWDSKTQVDFYIKYIFDLTQQRYILSCL